ncbi:hypothetical protein D9C01_13675, partial [Corynebacterium diphtheriae]
VGETITADSVRAVGAAFVDVLGLTGETVLVGGDMRPSSPAFMAAFAEGATHRGRDHHGRQRPRGGRRIRGRAGPDRRDRPGGRG